MPICKRCRKEFIPKTPGQVYCCRECYESVGEDKWCPRCKKHHPIDQFIDQKGQGRKSGYCTTCRQAKEKERSQSVRGRFQFGIKRAKSKGICWLLSMSDYEPLISSPCHYCTKKLDRTGVGLDRVDPELGYVANNVVPCCRRCNMVKGDNFTYEEMLRLSAVIRVLDSERRNN